MNNKEDKNLTFYEFCIYNYNEVSKYIMENSTPEQREELFKNSLQ